ncbi:MAG: dihydrofolate reductase [Candidatus Muproteobacteria bacterium RBG_16_60_9]|uniref:Dihydrofolate reductase n=1 Tax=Candidatus Muproteobacteria bacterium RBG_16_60_9 TaxID=1817755 RepID=A0A1F6V885_9PROT|nr:MAG: dihydrofolate reductase [Candidatus Muproteobacteria bacterium RBG_16_60_9]
MISLIAALAENRVIGNHNALPWRLPADLQHFRKLTTGNPVIMGRRNFESIGRPLPQRTNIVVTRRPNFQATGCIVVDSLDSAFAACREAPDVFIIGGAEIYAQTIDRADRLLLTLVHAAVPGDTFFPEIDWSPWRETARESHAPDERHAHAYSFVTYERTL